MLLRLGGVTAMARRRSPDAPEHPGHVSVPEYLLVGPVTDVWVLDMPSSADAMDRGLVAWSRWRRARSAWLAAHDLDLDDDRVPAELRQVRSPRPWTGDEPPPTVPTVLLHLPRHGALPPGAAALLIGH